MRALFSLIVASALLGFAAPAHAPTDRHATIAQASDEVAAPIIHDALAACTPALPFVAPLVFVASRSTTPRRAPTATLPLYLRDRSLLL